MMCIAVQSKTVYPGGSTMQYLELKIPPPFVALLTALAMAGLAYLGWLPLPLSLSWRLLCAFVVWGAALVVAGLGTRLFVQRKTTVLPMHPENTTALVTGGVYRYTRNPMYLGATLFLLGLGFALGDILSLFFIPCFVLYITHFQIVPEERALERLFGKEYMEYKRRVRRWL